MPLSKAEILAANDLPREVVPVPEWGGDVIVSTMTGASRDAWEAGMAGKEGADLLKDMRARLAVACMVDEAGARLFTDADVPALSAKSAAALERVTKVAQRLNRLGAKELEDLTGN